MSQLPEKTKKIKTTAFPFMVLAVSVILTFGVTYNFYQSAKSKDQIRFNNEVNRIQTAFENRLNLYLSLLKGGGGFVKSVEKLDWQSFANYVDSLEIEKNYSGIQGIGFSKLIKPAEEEELIKKLKSEGYTDFKMFPKNEGELHQAILYLEPLDERNQKAIGFDMSTEENRRRALESARDSGKAAVTAKITLLQEIDEEKQAGFLIYLPVYKYGQLPVTVEERRANLVGFIYSPFRAGDFLAEIEKNAATQQIGTAVYDGDVRPENLMAMSPANTQPAPDRSSSQFYQAQTELEIAGRKWQIVYISLPSFTDQSSVGWTPLIFLSGIAFSFLLFGMTYWEALGRAKLQLTTAELVELEKQRKILLANERTARLTAEQANATKDEFISVVSHELKTPLNAIAGWTRILKTDDLPDSTRNLALGKIEKNLRNQTKLVEQLIDYSQILAGNKTLDEKELDFSAVFENSFSEIEPMANRKNIEFIIENNLNGQKIYGDQEKLTIALQNLLANAVKFSDEGGSIRIGIIENNGSIQMTIKDNGRGIDPEFLPHIFERFSQADSSLTRNAGGLGLGLTISDQIIRLHQGTIRAESGGSGKGAIFTVTLPAKKDPEKA